MAHLIERDAPDPVCPMMGRPKWFRNDSFLSNIIPEIVNKVIYGTDPAFTTSDM